MSYSNISVTTSPTLIVAANPRRQSLIITNTDTNNKLYVGPDTSITTSNCPEIGTSGSLTEDNGGSKVYCGDVYGISTGTISVSYWERTEQ